MTMHPTRGLLAGLLVAVAATLAVATARADVSQTPNATGCPAGYELLNVAALEASGPYPDHVFGGTDRAGNNDGFVCGNAQPVAVQTVYCKQGIEVQCELEQLGLPRYLVKEDDNPASLNGPALSFHDY
jgi:hypothetical protein